MTERPVGRLLSATLANPRADRVKQVAALAGRSARRRAGQVLVEGPQAVRELVAHRAAHVRDVYVLEDALATRGPLAAIADAALDAGLYVHPVTSDVAHALSPDAQGIVAVASSSVVLAEFPATARLVAILSQVRDPGNAGAAIRVADAAGADAVVLAGDSVDPTNPKVVRATAGSLFHLPVVRAESLAAAISLTREAGLAVLAADVSGESELGSPGAPDLGGPTAWVFGNEAWGLSADELSLADHVVRIPIFGLAESLNLGTAAAVCLYASAWGSRRGA
ncbi:RNA methyltransferase [Demequina sp. TTPB684]|uniref:TrmH family RNA methyltransferase n=1 Tax=unclassified Demequina TaxID=2620311 RepID=UPI001CF316C0|nr:MULTISPECIES: RNA methyltransferase [unclassified Demequina]MCB2412599.1 RNA methyltransferase [Demequina sp. TTPB684]UPU89534.1 RNA methyltransferase [Demequina sp. TMPB413]